MSDVRDEMVRRSMSSVTDFTKWVVSGMQTSVGVGTRAGPSARQSPGFISIIIATAERAVCVGI